MYDIVVVVAAVYMLQVFSFHNSSRAAPDECLYVISRSLMILQAHIFTKNNAEVLLSAVAHVSRTCIATHRLFVSHSQSFFLRYFLGRPEAVCFTKNVRLLGPP